MAIDIITYNIYINISNNLFLNSLNPPIKFGFPGMKMSTSPRPVLPVLFCEFGEAKGGK